MRFLVVLLFALFAATSVFAADKASDVLQLTDDNFSEHIGGDQPALVEFYAPWCGHCKALAPEYEIVASAFKGHKVKIAAIDADFNREMASSEGIEGFPTIKFYPAGETKGEVYKGDRTAQALVDFMNRNVGTTVRVKPPHSDVTVLTERNFASIVNDPTKHVLVEFYAPWCGHCKQLAPQYEKVGTAFRGEKEVIIAKIDADTHRNLNEKYDVKGFPTIIYFPKDNKDGIPYTGGRTAEEFVSWINDNAGTERVIGGGYLSEAGRIEALDELVAKYMETEDINIKKSILSETEQLIKTELITEDENAEYAKFYVIAMKRSLENPSYAETEVQRIQRLLDGGKINQQQIEQFYKRININKLFLNKPQQE